MRNKLVASVVGIIGLLLGGWLLLLGGTTLPLLASSAVGLPLIYWIGTFGLLGMGGCLAAGGVAAWVKPENTAKFASVTMAAGLALWFQGGGRFFAYWAVIAGAYALLSLLNRPKAVQVAIAPIDPSAGLKMRAESI